MKWVTTTEDCRIKVCGPEMVTCGSCSQWHLFVAYTTSRGFQTVSTAALEVLKYLRCIRYYARLFFNQHIAPLFHLRRC